MSVQSVIMFGLVGLVASFFIFAIMDVCGLLKRHTAEKVILVFIVCAVLGGCIGSLAQDTDVTYRIYSLEDTTSLHGRFVLGSGTVDMYPAFFFYREVGNGGYKLCDVDARNTIVYEDTDEPYIHVHRVECDTDGVYTAEIHVPPGTIVRRMTLDGVS